MKQLINEAARVHINRELYIKDLRNLAMEFWNHQVNNKELLFGELTLLHVDMFNGTEQSDKYSLAAAVELLILSIDIFDDLEDGDGNALWAKLSPPLALNTATALLMLSNKVLHQAISSRKNDEFYNFYEKLLESISGQHLDLSNLVNSEEDYLEMVRRKSGSLTALACLAGSLHATEQQLGIINQYGEKIGVIAQINNDLNDLNNWETKSDIKQRKKSLPILYMLSQNHQLLKDYFDNEIDYNYLYPHKKEVLHQMTEAGAFHYAQIIVGLHKQRAYKLVDELEVCEIYKSKLKVYI